jgi:23S rRNA (cytosine1962-C5)-methyltransferase
MTSSTPQLVISNKKLQALLRFHPWVFSGAVKKKTPGLIEGDWVHAVDERGDFLACGFYGEGSIALRVLAFREVDTQEKIITRNIQQAAELRKRIGLFHSKHTNIFRLVNAEGDGMPGLIVDVYGSVAVVQCHHVGYLKFLNVIVDAILKSSYGQIDAVYNKSKSSLHAKSTTADGWLYGESKEPVCIENNVRFKVDVVSGQKTGFFIDQRDNRQLLGTMSKGKKVLNTFCYTGGFSIYALHNNAAVVHSVDSSETAVKLTDENVLLNGSSFAERHTSFKADVFEYFKTSENDYDVIVLDPPAFAKGLGARHNAVQAYKRLNLTALQKIKSGGVIFTFSCSQVVTPDLFEGAVLSAAIDAGRKVKIINRLFQPQDHPVSLFHPEGLYLKGLVLYVE